MSGNLSIDGEPELLVSVDEMMWAAGGVGSFVTFLALVNFVLVMLQSCARRYRDAPWELFFVWCFCERRQLSEHQHTVEDIEKSRRLSAKKSAEKLEESEKEMAEKSERLKNDVQGRQRLPYERFRDWCKSLCGPSSAPHEVEVGEKSLDPRLPKRGFLSETGCAHRFLQWADRTVFPTCDGTERRVVRYPCTETGTETNVLPLYLVAKAALDAHSSSMYFFFVLTTAFDMVESITSSANAYLEGDLEFANDPDRWVITITWSLEIANVALVAVFILYGVWNQMWIGVCAGAGHALESVSSIAYLHDHFPTVHKQLDNAAKFIQAHLRGRRARLLTHAALQHRNAETIADFFASERGAAGLKWVKCDRKPPHRTVLLQQHPRLREELKKSAPSKTFTRAEWEDITSGPDAASASSVPLTAVYVEVGGGWFKDIYVPVPQDPADGQNSQAAAPASEATAPVERATAAPQHEILVGSVPPSSAGKKDKANGFAFSWRVRNKERHRSLVKKTMDRFAKPAEARRASRVQQRAIEVMMWASVIISTMQVVVSSIAAASQVAAAGQPYGVAVGINSFLAVTLLFAKLFTLYDWPTVSALYAKRQNLTKGRLVPPNHIFTRLWRIFTRLWRACRQQPAGAATEQTPLLEPLCIQHRGKD